MAKDPNDITYTDDQMEEHARRDAAAAKVNDKAVTEQAKESFDGTAVAPDKPTAEDARHSANLPPKASK